MSTNAIMKPFVNNNGTSREQLVEQRIATRQALNETLEYHRAMAPHGRDYQGGGDYERDRKVWMERHTVLQIIYQALEEEALFIHREDY